MAVWAGPAFKLVYLFVELVRERPCPWLQLLVDEFLKDRDKRAFLADALVACRFIDQTDNADPPQASIESVRPLDDVGVSFRQGAFLMSAQDGINDAFQNLRWISIGSLACPRLVVQRLS